MVNFVLKIKVGNGSANELIDDNVINIIKQPNFSFKHVARRLNMGANDLAKQGCHKNHIIQGWF